AAGLRLDRGGSVAGHGLQVSVRPQLQTLAGTGMDGSGGGLLIAMGNPGGREYEVRVAIDEARHDHAASGVDLNGVASQGQVLYPPAGSYFHQDSIPDEE